MPQVQTRQGGECGPGWGQRAGEVLVVREADVLQLRERGPRCGQAACVAGAEGEGGGGAEVGQGGELLGMGLPVRGAWAGRQGGKREG